MTARAAAQAGRLQMVLPYGSSGSSARVRGLDWLDHLGLSAEVHTYLGLPVNSPRLVLSKPVRATRAELGLRRLARQVGDETVFLVREASPFSRGAVESELLARAGRGVYDFDDALQVQAPGVVEHLFSKAVKWRRSVQAADVVVAGNDLLAEAATAAGAADVRLIPSCVAPDQYRSRSEFNRDAGPRAIWLGSPATEEYLAQIADPLLAVHRSHGLRLSVISAGDRTLGALDQMVDRIAWTPKANDLIADHDFGLMPLPDDPWTRGKCAYKLLQYGAAGIAMIGSPVGANRAALAAMGGLAASTADQWRAALIELCTADAAELARLGRAGRSGVEQKYSFTSWAPAWRAAVGLGV